MYKRCILPILILLLLVPLCLSSCGDKKDGQDAELDQANQKVQYLTEQLTILQNELTEQKSQAYVNEIAYRNEIGKLQTQIERLGALINNSPVQIPSQNENAQPDQNVGVSTPPTNGEATSDKLTLTYVLKNGEAFITGYVGTAEILNIPTTLDGYTVTGVADNAFSRSPFVSVSIPDTVRELGWFAFSESFALKEITVPDSVTKAGYGVFENCTGKLCIVCSENSYISAYAKSYGISTSTKAQ